MKQVDNRIITLKREINKLKDILAESGTYQGFLTSLSPDSWRVKSSGKTSPNVKSSVKSSSQSGDQCEGILESLNEEDLASALQHLDMTSDDLG